MGNVTKRNHEPTLEADYYLGKQNPISLLSISYIVLNNVNETAVIYKYVPNFKHLKWYLSIQFRYEFIDEIGSILYIYFPKLASKINFQNIKLVWHWSPLYPFTVYLYMYTIYSKVHYSLQIFWYDTMQ